MKTSLLPISAALLFALPVACGGSSEIGGFGDSGVGGVSGSGGAAGTAAGGVGGTGGSVVGGAGGTVAGGAGGVGGTVVGGAGGVGGTVVGGAGGVGGTVVGGAGGVGGTVVGGAGGVGGTVVGGAGGVGGSGGTGGMGGSGGTGQVTCAQLASEYASTLSAAKQCNPAMSVLQCTVLVDNQLPCPCSTYANPSNTAAMTQLALLKTQWLKQQCNAGIICPAIACLLPSSAVCQGSSGGAGKGSCVDTKNN